MSESAFEIKYRFNTYITGDVEHDYAQWMKNERIRKIMDQRDDAGKKLLSSPKLEMAMQNDGTKVYKLEFVTTPDNFAKYGERVNEMKAHTAAAWKVNGVFTAESQLTFDKELSNDENYGRLLRGKDGTQLDFKPVNIENKAEYTVRIDIAHPDRLERPYEDWIKEHVDQMRELKDNNGELIFSGAKVRKAQEKSKDIYVIDYQTTNLKFWDYENLHADNMRSEFRKTYDPKVSGMTFDRDLLEEGLSFVNKAAHKAKKQGLGGRPLTFDVIYSYGCGAEKAA